MPSPLSGENTLDTIIYYCLSNGISCIEPHTDIRSHVKNGHFKFTCHRHDTGCNVKCWIVHPQTKEEYEIINTTFWYSSSHTFNDSKWETGVWDSALAGAIKYLADQVELHKQNKLKQKQAFV